jgi:hypothetical protein
MWQWYFSLNRELTDPYMGVLEASGDGENWRRCVLILFLFFN